MITRDELGKQYYDSIIRKGPPWDELPEDLRKQWSDDAWALAQEELALEGIIPPSEPGSA